MKSHRLLSLGAIAASLCLGAPAAAQQQSQGYKFLEAVEKEDGKTVTDMLDTPGSTIVNTRNVTTGKGALHILVPHSGSLFFRYLLEHGADPNIRNARGETPMVLATMAGREDLVRLLVDHKANVNLGNSSGQTPLILAVGNRDVAITRYLLANGADPDQTDNLAGMSARQYAARDARNPAIIQMLADAPKKATRGAAVAGPKLR